MNLAELAEKLDIINNIDNRYVFRYDKMLDKQPNCLNIDLHSEYDGQKMGIHIPNENVVDYFYHKRKFYNYYGDVISLANMFADVVNSYSYYAFGNTLEANEQVHNRF